MCVCERLGGHAIDQAPQLFDHSLYQLLFVSVVLPELREDVVLLTGILHPGDRETKAKSQSNIRVQEDKVPLYLLEGMEGASLQRGSYGHLKDASTPLLFALVPTSSGMCEHLV